MHQSEHLAIASVPIQKWDKLYENEKAFAIGTIFPQLNKPIHFAEDFELQINKQSLNDRDKLMREIQEVSFVIDDIRLYMDTHPEDQEGLEVLKKSIIKRKELLKQFASQYAPLTMDCMAEIYEKKPDSNCYCWQKGEIPWEGVCY